MRSQNAVEVLRVENIWKSYGDKEVLRGIDLAVNSHEVVALIGASGSGKSTLLRTMNLLETIDDGQVWLAGTDISTPTTTMMMVVVNVVMLMTMSEWRWL